MFRRPWTSAKGPPSAPFQREGFPTFLKGSDVAGRWSALLFRSSPPFRGAPTGEVEGVSGEVGSLWERDSPQS